MKSPGFRNIAVINIIACLASYLILQVFGPASMPTDDVVVFGQMLTTALLVLSAIVYLQGVRGKLAWMPIVLSASVGTLYAGLGGPVKNVMSYHFLAVILHVLTLRNYGRALADSGKDEQADTANLDASPVGDISQQIENPEGDEGVSESGDDAEQHRKA